MRAFSSAQPMEHEIFSKSYTIEVPWRAVLMFAMVWICLGVSTASSQLTISIAYQGPSAPTNGGPLDPGAALFVVPGPGAFPGEFLSSASLGLMPALYNSAEVDALTWGKDSRLERAGDYWGGNYRLFFSTDEFAAWDVGGGSPTVRSEGVLGNRQASADIQRTFLFMSQPAAPLPASYGHSSVIDGDGFAPFAGPGLGLVEPNFPAAGIDSGDTVDGLAAWSQSADMRLYFSLDADWTDPFEGIYGNSATAQTNGVNPGDILVSNGSGSFTVWASALVLGLDLNDDLDALILWENGNGSFNPSAEPYDWMGGDTDMVLFSVRRGSPVIGMPDSLLGLPIEEGDILTTPYDGGPYPAIFIRAESIGLSTVRDDGLGLPFTGYGDDLNAMMVQ